MYPAATFILTVLFVLGRVLHQVGYAHKGYGGHGVGFGVSLIATIVAEGLVFVAGLRADTNVVAERRTRLTMDGRRCVALSLGALARPRHPALRVFD